MTPSEERHWKRFNTLSRIVGVAFVAAGVVFVISGVGLLLDRGATIMVDGVPTDDPATKSVFLAAGLVVAILGSLLLLALPFRPPSRKA